MEIYSAIMQGNVIVLGLKYSDGLKDVAFFGKVSISEPELEQIKSCMSELIGYMQKDLEPRSK